MGGGGGGVVSARARRMAAAALTMPPLAMKLLQVGQDLHALLDRLDDLRVGHLAVGVTSGHAPAT